jgi:predicted DNA-binding transcriptional regulator YafY
MSKKESIARYNLIIKKLRKHPANFAEITDYLSLESELQDYDFTVSKRTFQRDLNDIRSLYDIDVHYDNSEKVYQIEVDQQSEANQRIMEAYDTFNALNITDRLSKHVHFEKRRPQGTENLYGFLHAIKNQVEVKFTHQKYWEDEATKRQVEPYALKEFRNRWYVLTWDLKDNHIKSFGLDRLSDLEITKKRFKFPENFDVTTYYKHCFGIVGPNAENPENIILSFTPFQGKYIKSLPLHESQTVLIDNEIEFRIKLKLFLTHDFYMEVLSFGENVKVIEPQSLINRLKTTVEKIAEN